MARRRKITVKPVLSAFVWGVLTGLGIDPSQMIVETTLKELGPYLQIVTIILLLLAIYFSYNWILEAIKRSRKTFRVAGTLGVVAIIAAFLSGVFIFSGERAAIVLLAAVIVWLYAIW